MRKKELPNEHKLIFLCARIETNNFINQEIIKLLNTPLDWDKIIKISSHQRVTPFLYYNLSKLNPQDIFSQPVFITIKNHYYANLQRNLIIEKEISRVLKETNLKGISFVPFKGLALLQNLYSCNPGLRIMDDVDILIKKDDFHKVHDILIQSGYFYNVDTKTSKKYQYEFLFSKTLSSGLNLFIEIHTLLNPARPFEVKLPFLWQRMRETVISGEKTSCLSREDMFLSLAMHLRRHTRRLNLKFIIDIIELLNNADEFDWQYIVKSARDNHIVNTVYFSLYISQELFNTPIACKVLKEFTPGAIKRHLIHLVLNKYNFFTLKKWQGVVLRFLLFDRFAGFFFYFWQVSLRERFISVITRRFNRNNEYPVRIIPVSADENTRK